MTGGPAVQPLISVVLPTRDRAALLHRSVRSLLEQDSCAWELVVVDDGSSDETEHVVRSFADPRIRYVRQEPRGAAAARNAGAAASTGSHVTFLDSDDEARSDWISALADSFARHGSDIVTCGFEEVFPLGRNRLPRCHLPQDLGPLFGHVVGSFTHAGTYAMSRPVFDAVGGFADDLRAAQHTELSYRLIPAAIKAGWRIDAIAAPLIRYHVGTPGGIRRNDAAVLEGARYIVDTHEGLLRRDPRRLANSLSIIGVRSAKLGRRRDAIWFLLRAVQVRPAWLRGWLRLAAAVVAPVGSFVWSLERNLWRRA